MKFSFLFLMSDMIFFFHSLNCFVSINIDKLRREKKITNDYTNALQTEKNTIKKEDVLYSVFINVKFMF